MSNSSYAPSPKKLLQGGVCLFTGIVVSPIGGGICATSMLISRLP